MKLLQTAAQKTADKLRSEGDKKAQKIEDEAAQRAETLLLKAQEEIQKIK